MGKKGAVQMIRENNGVKEKWCSACKAYHPATKAYFYHDSNSRYKLTSSCKKSQKTAKKTNSKKADTALTLDFSKDQGLLERISSEALSQRRSVDQQILWHLDRAIETELKE
ncbi:MAG: hypothetical protein MI862_26060 [Desulfobacterales bacterium]|nr:hypothetical protein [Desulfobacterales bacterium]